MASTTWSAFGPIAKKHYGAGREEGREVGLAEGEARAVLAVLETRAIEVTPAARERITGCTDTAQLTEWVRCSVTAATVEELASQWAARRIPEEIMASTNWSAFGPIAKLHYGRGFEEGRWEGLADSVLAVLEARGIEVTPVVRGWIVGCRDTDLLTEWVRCSVTAATVDDLFAAEA